MKEALKFWCFLFLGMAIGMILLAVMCPLTYWLMKHVEKFLRI